MFGRKNKKNDNDDSPNNSSTPLNAAADETPVGGGGGGAINNSTNSAVANTGPGTGTGAPAATLSTRTRLATPWQYPLYGVIYLFTSPSMICSVICAITFGLIIATTSLIILFVFTLQTQAEALTFGTTQDDDDDENGNTTTTWWSYMLAIFAVLFEATLITILLLKVVHTKSQKKIFVTTMKQENTWRDIIDYPNGNHMIEPGGIELFGCFKLSFIVSLITFPLHIFLPLVGTIVHSLLNSRLAAWELMDMYFVAINMDYKQQRNEIRSSGIVGASTDTTSKARMCGCLDISSKYVQFGFVCGLLESIPIIGPTLFPLTNACGAALWSADMEKQYGGPTSLQQQQQQQ